MKKLVILALAAVAITACKPVAPHDQPLPGEQRYRLTVGMPGQGQINMESKTERECNFDRAIVLTDNPGSFLVKNCHIVGK